MQQESICSLGYHSQTQWLIRPQIILLYDKVEMNKSVYDMIKDRGESKLSSIDYLLSRLLSEFAEEGILIVKNYEDKITPEDWDLVDKLVDHWISEFPDAFANLALELHLARIQRIREKRNYLDINEPMYAELSKILKESHDRVHLLEQGITPLNSREAVKHCLEHILLTKKALDNEELPIFEWQAYSRLREWIAALHFNPPTAQGLINDSLLSESNIVESALNVYVELFIGSLEVLDEKQLRSILHQRQKLKSARQEIQRLNHDIWQFVTMQNRDDQLSIADEFMDTLRERAERIKRQYESITLEQSASRQQPFNQFMLTTSSIIKAFVSTFFPIPSIASKIDEKFSDFTAKAKTDKKYPELSWCYVFQDYKHLHEKSLLKRSGLLATAGVPKKRNDVELRDVDFCQALGIAKDTLFEWESKGLLPKPELSWQGWRIYSRKHLEVGRRLFEDR